MIRHSEIASRALRNKIKNKMLKFGGNRRLKIYGMLRCLSGKKLKIENRVFFSSQAQAVQHGYRPCGDCMKEEYRRWKNGF